MICLSCAVRHEEKVMLFDVGIVATWPTVDVWSVKENEKCERQLHFWYDMNENKGKGKQNIVTV